MEIFVETLKKEVNKEISKIEKSETDIVMKSLKSAKVFENAVKKLKDFTLPYTFKDKSGEIRFFKEIKPWFCHQLIYHLVIYKIEIKRPQGTIKDQQKYLQGYMKEIDKDTGKYPDFNAYYRSGSIMLDDKLFVRGQDESFQYPESFTHEFDLRFSTHFDHFVAKLQANALILSYLKEEEEMLDSQNSISPGLPKVRLTWTGTKTSLKELIHALYYLKMFGNTSLVKLTEYFELIFNVELDKNMSRTLCDMRDRNNPTSFLDELKDRLLEQMFPGKKNKR